MALNLNQFGSILSGAAKGAARGLLGGPAGIATGGFAGAASSKGGQAVAKQAVGAVGNQVKRDVNMVKAVGGAAVKAAPTVAKAGLVAGLAMNPVTRAAGILGGAAYGASKIFGGGKGFGAGTSGSNVGKTKPSSVAPTTNYTVNKGDTLTSIAAKHGTSVAALRQANPKLTAAGSKYNNGNMIWSGTKITAPGLPQSGADAARAKATPVPNRAR